MIFRRILIPTILLCVLPLSERAVAETETNIDVEICFTLDTTGSMSGLIDGAKRKIWSIANDIASLSPRPNIKFCLLAYRDRGDAYVTKMHDLNADIDVIIKRCRAIRPTVEVTNLSQLIKPYMKPSMMFPGQKKKTP